MRHKYTLEQIRFLQDNINGKSYADIYRLFNKHFNLSLSKCQIIGTCKRYGFHSGINSQFRHGSIPHNKGLKGFNAGNPTRFKKGNMPKNHKPVGTEKIDAYGYLTVKVAEPKSWKLKHVVLWERKNGKVPNGHVIIFADGNRKNLTIKNLMLVSRRELMIMNTCGLIYDNGEFTKTGKLIADVRLKIGELSRIT